MFAQVLASYQQKAEIAVVGGPDKCALYNAYLSNLFVNFSVVKMIFAHIKDLGSLSNINFVCDNNLKCYVEVDLSLSC